MRVYNFIAVLCVLVAVFGAATASDNDVSLIEAGELTDLNLDEECGNAVTFKFTTTSCGCPVSRHCCRDGGRLSSCPHANGVCCGSGACCPSGHTCVPQGGQMMCKPGATNNAPKITFGAQTIVPGGVVKNGGGGGKADFVYADGGGTQPVVNGDVATAERLAVPQTSDDLQAAVSSGAKPASPRGQAAVATAPRGGVVPAGSRKSAKRVIGKKLGTAATVSNKKKRVPRAAVRRLPKPQRSTVKPVAVPGQPFVLQNVQFSKYFRLAQPNPIVDAAGNVPVIGPSGRVLAMPAQSIAQSIQDQPTSTSDALQAPALERSRFFTVAAQRVNPVTGVTEKQLQFKYGGGSRWVPSRDVRIVRRSSPYANRVPKPADVQADAAAQQVSAPMGAPMQQPQVMAPPPAYDDVEKDVSDVVGNEVVNHLDKINKAAKSVGSNAEFIRLLKNKGRQAVQALSSAGLYTKQAARNAIQNAMRQTIDRVRRGKPLAQEDEDLAYDHPNSNARKRKAKKKAKKAVKKAKKAIKQAKEAAEEAAPEAAEEVVEEAKKQVKKAKKKVKKQAKKKVKKAKKKAKKAKKKAKKAKKKTKKAKKKSRKRCFAADTAVEMADGSVKPMASVVVGDVTLHGGRVTGVMAFAGHAAELYDYAGVVVEGSHMVLEDGEFVAVGKSRIGQALQLQVDALYDLNTETHRLVLNGVTFADFSEIAAHTTVESLELTALNNDAEKH